MAPVVCMRTCVRVCVWCVCMSAGCTRARTLADGLQERPSTALRQVTLSIVSQLAPSARHTKTVLS